MRLCSGETDTSWREDTATWPGRVVCNSDWRSLRFGSRSRTQSAGALDAGWRADNGSVARMADAFRATAAPVGMDHLSQRATLAPVCIGRFADGTSVRFSDGARGMPTPRRRRRRRTNEIGVSVKDGVVTLAGWVDSYTKKWAAEEAAHRVRGVKAVANDIEVRLRGSSQRTDADIAAAAVRALQWDAFLSADKIDVSVSKGWVTLKGQVEWQYQKQEAERVVRRLAGVTGVTNLIVVKPG